MKKPPDRLAKVKAEFVEEAMMPFLWTAPTLEPAIGGRRPNFGKFIRAFRGHLLERAQRVFDAQGISWDAETVRRIAHTTEPGAGGGDGPTAVQRAAIVAIAASGLEVAGESNLSGDERVANAIFSVRLVATMDHLSQKQLAGVEAQLRSLIGNNAKRGSVQQRVSKLAKAIQSGAVRPTPKEVVSWRGLPQEKKHQEAARRDIHLARARRPPK